MTDHVTNSQIPVRTGNTEKNKTASTTHLLNTLNNRYFVVRMPAPTPISVLQSKIPSANAAGQTTPNLIGSGHLGAHLLNRIVMSLKSGLTDEIDWALTSIYQQSFIVPETINLEENEYLGHRLIEYFYLPFKLLKHNQYDKLNATLFTQSLNAILTIRNLVQDLSNQQWLSQIKVFKSHLIEVLRFLTNWFYTDAPDTQYFLNQYMNQFNEYCYHIMEILDHLTCYYTDSTRNDSLFNLVLIMAGKSKDKFLIVESLNCLTHLLFLRPHVDASSESSATMAAGSTGQTTNSDNCINAITESDLEHFVNYLLLSDPKINYAVLQFVYQYLKSDSTISHYNVKESKTLRFNKLLQLNNENYDFKNLHTLFKQLPLILLENLSLNEPLNKPPAIVEHLVRRSDYFSVPLEVPQLPADLYEVILNFPEPLRASTWLRCCYEPFFNEHYDDSLLEKNDKIIPGEVTQISLWKAYEKQFENIWKHDKVNELPPLLPAVDFIKNVSNAFPNSEAMVVVLNNQEESYQEQPPPPKKKFIIRGIQPRQFVVNIDEGNYEALKRKTINNTQNIKRESPIGTIDIQLFHKNLSESLINTAQVSNVPRVKLNPLNLLAKDFLDVIFNELLIRENSSDFINIFKLYNKYWLLDLIVANPSLLEIELVDTNWIKYLL